jgi:hypothetical protein
VSSDRAKTVEPHWLGRLGVNTVVSSDPDDPGYLIPYPHIFGHFLQLTCPRCDASFFTMGGYVKHYRNPEDSPPSTGMTKKVRP